MIRFHALGGLTVIQEGHGELGIGGPRQRRLLAMLLIHRNSVVSVDRLADAVFAGDPTPAASTTLRSYVARTRKLVNGDGNGTVVVTQAPGYLLRTPDEAFDVTCFERSVAEGSARLERDEATAASSLLREALSLWRGRPTRSSRTRSGPVMRLSAWRSSAWWLTSGSSTPSWTAAGKPRLIPEIESLVREHPFREGFRAQLMTALYRSGRHADALRVYRDYRQLLIDELGVEPSPVWPNSSNGSSTTIPRWCRPSRRDVPCGDIASASGWEPAATGPCTPRACPASSATSPSGSSDKTSPTARSSSARSRQERNGCRLYGPRGSCRSTTTGANQALPTS